MPSRLIVMVSAVPCLIGERTRTRRCRRLSAHHKHSEDVVQSETCAGGSLIVDASDAWWLPGPSLLLFWDGVCSSGGGWWLRNLVGSAARGLTTDVAGVAVPARAETGECNKCKTSPRPSPPTANFRFRSGAPPAHSKRVDSARHPSACVCCVANPSRAAA